MSALQIRDIPEDIYYALSQEAKRQNRSLTQQAIIALAKGLEVELNKKVKRKALLEEAEAKPLKVGKGYKNPLDLIREDRER